MTAEATDIPIVCLALFKSLNHSLSYFKTINIAAISGGGVISLLGRYTTIKQVRAI